MNNSFKQNVDRAVAAGIPILQVFQWIAAHASEIIAGGVTLYQVITQLIEMWKKDHPTS